MTRLSHLPAERQLQTWVVSLLCWSVVVAVMVTGRGLAGDSRELWDILATGTALGGGAALAAQLPMLVRKHRAGIAEIRGLKGQYAKAAVVLALVPLLAGAWLTWSVALAPLLLGIATWVLVRRVTTIPEEQMTRQIDYLDPEAWSGPSFLGERFVFLKAVGLGLLLGASVLAAALYLAA